MKFLSVLVVSIALLSNPVNAKTLQDNVRLNILFETDQAERNAQEKDWPAINKHDAERRVVVSSMVKSGAIQTENDYYRAALIFQHGLTYDDIRLANALTVLGLAIAPQDKKLRRLNGMTWDRMMMQKNRPQWYGTQYLKSGSDDAWSLYLIDESAVSDQERLEMDLPSLQEAKKKLVEMNSEFLAKTKPVSAPAAITSQTAQIKLAMHIPTMHALIEKDPSLGLFWYMLADTGIRDVLQRDKPLKLRLSFISRNKSEALDVVDGKQKLYGSKTSSEACFIDYIASVDDQNRLILDLAIDDKVQAGPKLAIQPYKYYRIVAGSLNADLRGDHLQLISIQDIVGK